MELDIEGVYKELNEILGKIRASLDIDKKKSRVLELEQEAGNNDFWSDQKKAQAVMQEIKELKVDTEAWQDLYNDLNDEYELWELAAQEKDDVLVKDAKNKFSDLKTKVGALSLRAKLSGKFDKNNAIVTLHSGAGGTEACDWVDMLLRMYSRWCEKKGYSIEILDVLPGEEVGVKNIVFLVKGLYAYGYLKSEVGVHRLVRISPFDSNKRRHTSFASCDVIPEIEDDIDIKVEDKDLRIDTYRASGAGGQHVNKTESAVRITHIPTGVVVQCQTDRSQHKNKASAMKLLKARLFELEQEKKRKDTEKHYDDKGAIAWGNQIRSYVFCPYTLVKDHRTGHEAGNLQAVMDGDLDSFIDAFLLK